MVEESQRMLREEGQFNRAEELRGLRWYFPLDKKDFFSTIETFKTFMADRSSSIRECLAHMEKINMNSTEFLKLQFSKFFVDYIPLDIIHIMFPAYLNEGIKILFRIGYSFFKTLKNVILKTKSQDEFEMNCTDALERLNTDEKKKFINTCYHLRIVRIKKQFSLIDTHKCSNHCSYICEPAIVGGDSVILTSSLLINQLYDFIPSIHKANDLNMIFATWRDGRSIQYMVTLAEKFCEEMPGYVMIIQADDSSIFGAYLQHSLKKSSGKTKNQGSGEDFLFRLQPDPKCFCGVKGNHTYFDFDGQDIYIGACKSGCGLLIESDLKQGHTAKSEVFNCPPLTASGKKDFQIVNLELFSFV